MTIEEALAKLDRKSLARALTFEMNLKLRTEMLKTNPSQRDVSDELMKIRDQWKVEP